MGIWAIAITGMDSSAGGLLCRAEATRAVAAAISWQTFVALVACMQAWHDRIAEPMGTR